MIRQHGRHAAPSRGQVALVMLLCGLAATVVAACGLAVASGTGHPATPLGRHGFVPVPRGRQEPVPLPSTGGRAGPPVYLTIPSIGVKTRLIHLGVTSAGTLQVPTTTSVAGWFTGSPRPGDIGSSVIAGHIDSYRGPGIFFRLRLLHSGDRVYVRQAGGAIAKFRVTAVQMYLKTRFPTESVYGPAPDAELRLITCGGTFDAATGHYLSNVVVYATLMH